MRRIAFTLISLACSVALATTVYKWVDENGVVHYSDQPHPNAQKLQIEGVQTYSSKSAAAHAPAASEPETQAEPAQSYRGCAIAQPLDQQNLQNAQSVFIRVQTDPQVRRGDQIFITMDGTALNGGQATGMSFNVTPIDRGAHTVQAQVKDTNGQTLCQTPAITFYVQQPNLFTPGVNAEPGNGPPPKPR
ncbi:MAG: DUF4124 domain-containing protein [Steroidobacteraceae bacterium]